MKRNVMAAALLFGSAQAGFALEAKVTKDTAASAAATWGAIGDFCGIANWHPAVAKCEMSAKDGATFRTLTLKDGAKLLEKQIAFDPAAMSYSYSIEDGPLPVANYKSVLKVIAKDKGATVEWSGTFDGKGKPDGDVVKIISGIYEAGVDALVSKPAK